MTVTLPRYLAGSFIHLVDEGVLQEFYKKLPDYYFRSPKNWEEVREHIKISIVDKIMDDDGNLLHRPSSPRLVVEYLRTITPGFYNRSYRKHMPRPAILDRQW